MLGFVDVILRVPPVFIIDEILKISMGLPFNTQTDSTLLESGKMSIADSAAEVFVNESAEGGFSLAAAINGSFDEAINGTTEALHASHTLGASDDTEFYKILSLTSLKFLSCLLGECYAARAPKR